MAQMPYKIVKNELFGRYMVANKNIKQGELILKELPKLVGPQINGALICFGCCKNLRFGSIGYDFCTECHKAVLCKKTCQGIYHTSEECSTLKSLQIEGQTIAEYDQICFALRCILLRKHSPELFQNIMELESHLEKRRDTLIWRRHKFIVEKVLLENGCLEKQDANEELVQKICGIIDVNTFEIRPPGESFIGLMRSESHCLRGLYLNAAMMAHDCLANTHLSVDDNFTLSIYAAVNIEEDSPIYFNYANVLQGTLVRKEHLREGKYFECICTRCKDPTELGTELSSLRCHKCHRGLIRSCVPEKINSEWKCDECQNAFKESLIVMAVDEARRKIEDTDPLNIQEMEALLKKLSQTFHSNHYLIMELIQNLVGAYSQTVPNKKNLARKIELCKRILEVFSKIEPGLSRIRAISLYQLQSAMVSLCHKQYRDSEITIEGLVSELLYAENILKESVKLLLYEPLKSPEGRMGQNALSELKMLRMSIGNIQRDFFHAEEKTLKNTTGRPQKNKPGKENVTAENTTKNFRPKQGKENSVAEGITKKVTPKQGKVSGVTEDTTENLVPKLGEENGFAEDTIQDLNHPDISNKTEVISKRSRKKKNKNK